jgi:hypothetical protein
VQDDSNNRKARPRRWRRWSRSAKIALVFVVAVILAGAGWLLATVGDGEAEAPWAELPANTTTTVGFWLEEDLVSSTTTNGPQELEPTTTLAPTTTTTVAPGPPGRQIGAIVYLEGKGLPEGTFEALEGLHATEVYLYVAYYSDAYYAIPRNPYGMALPADTLKTAIEDLHDKGYRVIGVISTALLDWRQAPEEGLAILQNDQKPIFDPVKAGPFVEQLTQCLVRYPLDGIYVGEPYWLESTSDVDKKLEWNRLYEKLLAITQEAEIPFHMIMPTFNGYFTLHTSFAQLPFQTIGMDAEFSYYTEEWNTNIDYFNNLIDITQQLAGGRDAIIEINLHKGMESKAVPPEYFEEEVRIAKEAGMKRIVIFAATFWAKMPDKDRYSNALAGFLAD